MSKRSRCLVALAVPVLLATVVPAHGQAAGETTTARQEMSGVLPATCAGDLAWSLVFHTTNAVRTDGALGLHLVSRFNVSNFTASDADGRVYRGAHAGQWSYYIACDDSGCEYPMEMVFVSTFVAAGQGSAPNLKIRIRQHVVVNANATVTVYNDLTEASCE